MSQNIAPFLRRIRTFLFLSAVVCAFIMASSPAMYAQTIEVKGTVVSKTDGLPMIGAFVVEQGTTNGVTVDSDGAFSIRVKDGAMLEISTMGYKTELVQAVAGKNLEILLTEDTELLDDVVVVGYGVQKKKLVTGATVQVKGDDVAKLNTTSVLGALQSQSPGVNITQTSGFLDQGYKVNIRGLGTTGDSAPLYVIDGVAGGSISALNPSDIESVDVLKDAASAAIYGARAANGVILVTTKKGKEGHSYISYDGYYGFQNLYKIPTSLNAQEFMTMQDEARAMDGLAGNDWANLVGSRIYSALQAGWEGTNWMKEMLNKNAAIQSHALTVAGGSERSTYSLGLSYMGQDATMGVPDQIPTMNRYNLRLNNDYIVFKKGDITVLTIGETLNYRYSETKGSFATGDIYWNGVRNALVKSPLMPAYNPDGSYYLLADQLVDGYQWDITNNDDVNPLAQMEYTANGNKSKQHYLQASVYANIQPIKNLNIRTQFGYMMGASSSRSYTPTYELGRISSQAEDKVSQSQSVYNRFTWDNTISYGMRFGEHQIDALAGASMEKWGFGESISASKRNSLFNDLEHAYLSNVPGDPSSTSTISGSPHSQGSLASFFFRANWNYREKYMVSATVRADGSSNFSRGNRWGIFPSVSAGWVMSNEPFFEPVKNYVDFLKIRASWGQNGNCNVNAFEYLARISIGDGVGQGYPFGDPVTGQSIGAYSSKLTNPDLSWERSEQIDLGLDARFFNSRLAFEFDWYNKETKDWLVTAPVLYSYGTGAAAINGGNVRNRGIEFAFRWNDEIGSVHYGVSLNGATNSNEVTKIANADGIIHGANSVPWESADEIYRAEVGKPMGYFYGYKTAGVFQTQDQIDSYNKPLLNGDKTRPGDLIFVDVNNDGKIDADDRTQIGNPHPDFTMGLSFNVEWKGIDLSFTGFGAFGHQIFKCYRDYTTSPLANFTTEIYQRWTGAGSTNKWPRLSSSSNSNWSTISDLYLEDADYFKIQNITLGFDFAKVFKSLPLQSLRVYVTGQNLFTFTSYSGMDPEIGYGADHDWAQGIDLGFYPSSRNILIGVNVKF